VHRAVDRANRIAYVATPDGDPILASEVSEKRAIYLRKASGDIHCDEQSTPPIYNYARFLTWTLAVEDIYCAFREASVHSDNHQPVSGQGWEIGDRNTMVHHLNRRGSRAQVTAYGNFEPGEIFINRRYRRGSGVVSRCLLAASVALFLTWGTTG
jgi:hypothetical protein